MIRSLVTPIALLALAALAWPAFGQSVPEAAGEAARAAEAAEAVAAQARGTFERIDPDSEMPANDAAMASYAGLPPLVEAAPAPAPAAEPAPPRGPAVRMIAEPVVQPLPAAAPRPAPNPTPKPAARPAAKAPRPEPQPFIVKSILPIEGTIRYGDWFWDESAAPATGQLVITVDLEARVLSAFRDGHEIGTAVVLVGTPSHPTPLGVFPVLDKSRQHFSRKYDNAPMPWSLWLTRTGIAIHGSPVMNGYASHGCIGVPDEFAAKLFEATKRGDKVIITRGRMIGVGDKVL
ncbi:L,D-transpeptidase family protein [Erythrobacter cryptus]|uniref:L,D-transpeptidase family protein n=1 Tax=Erythrobacter cryptus TaxID=196588 RepID=UPI00041F376B|nr:L,D-transpeptidase family protein [Erythrobacter cryptus]